MKIDIKNIIKNKKFLFSALGILLIILIVALAIIFWSKKSPEGGEPGSLTDAAGKNLPAPEFLTDEEKDSFGLPAEVKAQALTRDVSGKILVYKIIKSDNDVVLDPAAIGPISPRQK